MLQQSDTAAAIEAVRAGIIAAREARGLTQPALAHLAGLTLSTYRNLEQGRITPGIPHLFAIARGLELDSWVELLGVEVPVTTAGAAAHPAAVRRMGAALADALECWEALRAAAAGPPGLAAQAVIGGDAATLGSILARLLAGDD